MFVLYILVQPRVSVCELEVRSSLLYFEREMPPIALGAWSPPDSSWGHWSFKDPVHLKSSLGGGEK